MGCIDIIKQSKPKGDIVVVAYLLIIACILQLIIGVGLIVIAIVLPNNEQTALYVFQWIFAGFAIIFPWLGILSAWKALLPGLIIFALYALAQILWNIIYIICVAIFSNTVRKIVQIIFASIEIILGIVLFVLSTLMSGLLINYYRLQE